MFPKNGDLPQIDFSRSRNQSRQEECGWPNQGEQRPSGPKECRDGRDAPQGDTGLLGHSRDGRDEVTAPKQVRTSIPEARRWPRRTVPDRLPFD
jgi:hypothetical protein